MTEPLKYKRLLLKLSGEAMMGEQGFGIDTAVTERLARDVAEAAAAGCEIAVVVGGGNIFRGLAGAACSSSTTLAELTTPGRPAPGWVPAPTK